KEIEPRQRRRLAGFSCRIDNALYIGLDRRDGALRNAELPEPLAVEPDRIALLPFLELALGTIFGRIGARVPAVAVGQAFNERRPAAGTRLLVSRHGGAVNRVGVVAVDQDAIEPVGRGAVGGRMLDRGPA